MKIIYIDHYDSFSFNVIDWLKKGSQHIEIIHIQFDEPDIEKKIEGNFYPIVISPGPKSPYETTTTNKIISENLHKVPILGICLGHQILGNIAGSQILLSSEPLHGVVRPIKLNGCKFLQNHTSKNTLNIAAYNSLIISEPSSEGWKVVGLSKNAEIQIIENWKNLVAPAIGIQGHPESFLSEDGEIILHAWFEIIRKYYNTLVK